MVLAAACGDEKVEKRGHPIVNTYAVSDLNEQGVTLNGEILDIGDGVKEYGFFYGPASITDDKSSYNDRIVIGSMESPGEFSAIANRNMIKDREYYYRAYAVAKLSNVLVLGQELKFVSKGSTPPVVKDFYPKEGTVGDEVVVVGSNFSSSPSGNFVKFGPITATITEIRKDTLIARVPNSTPLDGALVSVEVGQLKSESKDKFQILPVTFSSYEPAIAGFSDTVIVKGKNFPLYLQGAQATFLNFISYPVKSTRTEMKFVVSEFVKVIKSTVKISAGLQSKTFDDEIKLAPPIITAFNPIKASKDVIVTITGDYFSTDKTSDVVTLAGKTLEITEVTRKTLKVKIATGITPGKYPFIVKVVGQTATSTEQIEIIKPEIESILPLTGTWGTEVTITGKNFGLQPIDNIVTFNTVAATITSASNTELKVIVPDGVNTVSSTIAVQVKTADNQKQTFASPFILNPPQIVSFTPNEGKGQTVVTITGSNFHPTVDGNKVWFGNEASGKLGEILSSTPTQITVRPPNQIDTLLNLTIKSATQSVVSVDKFHIVSPWRKVKSFPGPERTDATAFSAGGFGYVGLGTATGTAKRFWKYDPSTNNWTEIAQFTSMTTPTSTSGFVDIRGFSINDIGFVGVGNFGSGIDRGSFAKYDPATNTWTKMATLPDNIINAGSFSINGKAYVVGGDDGSGNASDRVWEFDPVSNQWTAKKKFYHPLTQASSFTINSKAYYFHGKICTQGCGPYVAIATFEYDVASDTWTEKGFFQDGRTDMATFSINGKGYAIGGRLYSGQYVADVYQYDPTLGAWKKLLDFPSGVISGAASFVIGDKAYFGAGRLGGSNRKDFWEFDPSKL